MRNTTIDADVTIAGDTAILRIKGQPDIRARVLGEVVNEGGRSIYLDRLVHDPWIEKVGPYRVSGAISTILSTEQANDDC